MRIRWLLNLPFDKKDGHLSSKLASNRYRVLPAIRELTHSGHTVDAAFQGAIRDARHWAQHWTPCDIVVVSKVNYEVMPPLVRFLQTQSVKIVADVCDDHFETPEYRDGFHDLIHSADYVIASTPAMAECITRHTGRQAAIIQDPYEAPPGIPAFREAETDRLRLLWFGSPTNLPTLQKTVPDLFEFAHQQPLSLRIVTDLSQGSVVEFWNGVAAQSGGKLTIECLNWSLDEQWSHFDETDIVLIPAADETRWLVKSPNRAVESLRCGRFVVAYPIPSYAPLADFTWQGEQLTEGLAWAIAHPDEVRERVRRGQQFVASEYDPAKIAGRWVQCLQAVHDGTLRIAQ